MKYWIKWLLVSSLLVLASFSLLSVEHSSTPGGQAATQHTAVATLAGGCFWCTESDMEHLKGVINVVSGYSGGHVDHPTYKQVSSGSTGHVESVQVTYDTSKLSYEQVLDYFFRHIDPTDDQGSFVDRGQQYRPVIFYHNEEQRRIALSFMKEIDASGIFKKPLKCVFRSIPNSHFGMTRTPISV